MLTSLLASFALSKKKKKKFRGVHSWNPPSLLHVLSFYKCLVCVFCLFNYFYQCCLCFTGRTYCIYWTEIQLQQLSNFWKEKTLQIVNFWYQLIIQCNTDSCCEHLTGGVNIYLYGCVGLLVSERAVYLCLHMCETHSKVILVLRYQDSIFIDPKYH